MIHSIVRWTTCALAFAVSLLPPASAAEPRARPAKPALAVEWQAGAATVVITPDVPVWMSGYGDRTAPGKTVAVDLQAKALAIKDATGKTVVIVTTDLLGIPRPLRDAVARQVETKYQIPNHALLINASHTHCGPEIRAVETSLSQVDAARAQSVAAYRARLEAKLVEVAGAALAKLEPAQLAYAHAKAGFAMNRRQNYALSPGQPGYGVVPDPDGPVDHAVPVLEVKNAAGETKALLFGYACHSTTAKLQAIHGDYSSFAQQALEKTYPGAIALFMLGCAGDQNPYPRHGQVPGTSPLEVAKIHGQSLASAVMAALGTQPRPLSGALSVALEDVALPYDSPPSRNDLERAAKSADLAERDYATVRLEKLQREGKLPSTYPYPIQIIRFGAGLTLVALASEVVVDFSHRLKRELPGPVWVAAYSNDYCGYLPSRRIWTEGGYEGGGSIPYGRTVLWRTVHSNKWDVSVEDHIVKKVHELHGKTAPKP